MIWTQSSEKRLVIWRNFRKSLENQPLKTAAEMLARWWADIPIAEGYSTPWATDSWPDPWNLLSEGPLNHTHTSVAMAYTLWLSVAAEDKYRIELAVINDIARRQILLVVIVDNETMINYNVGETIDTSQLTEDIETLASYSYSTFKSRIKA